MHVIEVYSVPEKLEQMDSRKNVFLRNVNDRNAKGRVLEYIFVSTYSSEFGLGCN